MNEKENKFYIQGFGGSPDTPKQRTPVEAPEGVSGKLPKNVYPGDLQGTGLSVSLTQIEIQDLISEGEIEGIITGKYIYSGNIGQTGWNSVVFNPYPDPSGSSAKWLRGTYWNEVPLVDNDNNYNFQRIQIAATNGYPDGVTWENLNSSLHDELEVARQINERLRGGEEKFAKTYRIINQYVKGVRVNVKVTQLFAQATEKIKEKVTITKTNKKGKTKTKTKKQVTEDVGDIVKSRVEYEVYTRPLFTNSVVREVNSDNDIGTSYTLRATEVVLGKISQGYIRTTYIPLVETKENYSAQPDFIGWEIKILRKTPDSETSKIRNQTFVDSLVEVYGDIFTYPNSAIVNSRFSAEYFSQVPNRSYDVKGIKVKVPSNYNTLRSSYNGEWDGTFKDEKEWTDNPAWIYYDLLTNPRYGLGKYIEEDSIDKWTLYDIGQYCDVLVADGFGGLEKRMSCNLVLNARGEAYEVVNNLASVFRGMTYYAGGSIYCVQDSQKNQNSFYQFTNANVENGDFQYSSSSRRVRHTVAIVRYNDKTNFYKPAVEYVEDADGIRKYGIRELELPAFGCTSRGQAIRFGRWALLTETLETESLTFTAGLEAAYLRPGDVFKIFDFNRRGQRYGGRTLEVYNYFTYSRVILDSNVSGLYNDNNYKFSLLTPSYFYDSSIVNITGSSQISNIRRNQVQIINFNGAAASGITGPQNNTVTEITFLSPFDTGNYNVTGRLVWTIEGIGDYDLQTNPTAEQYDYYRTIRIEEKEPHKYTIAAIQYNDGKFDQIESGFSFVGQGTRDLPTCPTALNLTLQPKPNLLHTKQILYQFNQPVSQVPPASYNLYVRTGQWGPDDISSLSGSNYLYKTIPISNTNTYEGYYYPSENTTYRFRVYSVNRQGDLSSCYAGKDILVDGIDPVQDVIINSLRLFDDPNTINESATMWKSETDDENPLVVWELGQDNVADLKLNYRITVREPSSNNIPTDHIYFSGYPYTPDNPADPSWEFNLEDNFNAVSSKGVAYPNRSLRSYDIVVEAVDSQGDSSAGGNIFNIAKDYDANYNTKGYDILHLNNEKPSGIFLTPLENSIYVPEINAYTYENFATKQWIATDGQIKLQMITGNIEDDIDGAYVFYTTGKTAFTVDQALGTNPPYNIQHSFVTNINTTTTDNTIEFNVNLTGQKEAYMMVGLMDFLDTSLVLSGTYNATGDMNFSNVVKIKRQGEFAEKESLILRAWIEFLNISNNSSTWDYREAGIQTVRYAQIGNSQRFTVDLIFDEELPNNDYTIIGYQPLPDQNNYPDLKWSNMIRLKGTTNISSDSSQLMDIHYINNPVRLTTTTSLDVSRIYSKFIGVLYGERHSPRST